MDAAVDVTLRYLNQYFTNTFDLVDATRYDTLEGARTGFSADFRNIEYLVSTFFQPTSVFIPSPAEMDTLIETAFQQPAVNDLLLMLEDLPADNPFSKTTDVQYSIVQRRSSDGGRNINSGLLSGAFLIAFVVTGAAAAHRTGVLDKLLARIKYSKASQHDIADGVSVATSSVGSPSTIHHNRDYDDDDGYRSRIIDDEEVEVEFFYPDSCVDEIVRYDPLKAPPSSEGDDEVPKSRGDCV